jgi:hypothetical protein
MYHVGWDAVPGDRYHSISSYNVLCCEPTACHPAHSVRPLDISPLRSQVQQRRELRPVSSMVRCPYDTQRPKNQQRTLSVSDTVQLKCMPCDHARLPDDHATCDDHVATGYNASVTRYDAVMKRL